MFCGKCGEQMVENAKFCGKCGMSNQPSPNIASKTEVQQVLSTPPTDPLFYSEDWSQRKAVVAAIPYFDVMADREYLYLIKLGQYYGSTIGLILGLFIMTLLGAILGYYIGNSRDKRKRGFERSLWIDANHKLISRVYERYLFLKIPLSQLKSCVTFEKHKMIIISNGQKITFAKKAEEVVRLNQFINGYVL